MDITTRCNFCSLKYAIKRMFVYTGILEFNLGQTFHYQNITELSKCIQKPKKCVNYFSATSFFSLKLKNLHVCIKSSLFDKIFSGVVLVSSKQKYDVLETISASTIGEQRFPTMWLCTMAMLGCWPHKFKSITI